MPKKETAEIFSIGKAAPDRWTGSCKSTGSVQFEKSTNRRTRKLIAGDLVEFIRNSPSAAPEEIGENFSAARQAVHRRSGLLVAACKKTFLHEEIDWPKRKEFEDTVKNKNSVVYRDESGLKNSTACGHGWPKRGEKICSKKKGHATEKPAVLAGTVGNRTVSPAADNSAAGPNFFNIWIDRQLLPELKEKSTVVLDSAGFRRNIKTKEIVDRQGRKLLRLPTYSPGSDPLENFWVLPEAKTGKTVAGCSSLWDCVGEVFRTIFK